MGTRPEPRPHNCGPPPLPPRSSQRPVCAPPSASPRASALARSLLRAVLERTLARAAEVVVAGIDLLDQIEIRNLGEVRAWPEEEPTRPLDVLQVEGVAEAQERGVHHLYGNLLLMRHGRELLDELHLHPRVLVHHRGDLVRGTAHLLGLRTLHALELRALEIPVAEVG